MKVYADNAATTPMSQAALDEMIPALKETYGNPSAPYSVGQEAKIAMESARYEMADALGCKTAELTFTSGGSEANNQAILSMAAIGAAAQRPHIVAAAFEHVSVLASLEQLKAMGFEVTLIKVPADGIVTPELIGRELRPQTCAVTLMTANNEVGTIQPIAEVADVCRKRDILFHTDAVAAAGVVPLDVDAMGVDYLTLSAHKFGGPKGVGAVFCRSGLELTKTIQGGGQERGKRAGTENVPGIVGMAAAFCNRCEHLEENAKKTAALRDRLAEKLLKLPGTVRNGSEDYCVPGTLNLTFEGLEAETMVTMLDRAGICISAGSACSAGAAEPSHVLMSMGRSEEEARSSIRISLNADNTEDEISYLAAGVRACVERLRRP